MRTIDRIFVTMTALALTSGTAVAQTVVTPRGLRTVTPVPAVAPAPVVAQVPVVVQTPVVAPTPLKLDRMTLDELSVVMPDLMTKLADLSIQMPDVQVVTRQALDKIEKFDFKFDKFDFKFDKFDFDFDWDQNYTYVTSQGDGNYSSCKDAAMNGRYDQAVSRCDRVIAAKSSKVDGALYWKAYSQFKLGRSEDSQATIAVLRKEHAQSPYLADVKTLEADIKKRGGQPVNVSDVDDDELKLLALNGLKNADPERAIPLIESMLASTSSIRLKKNALYILAQSSHPRAHQILLNYAKGGGNPDLQLEAIRYLTVNRDSKTAGSELLQIYQSTQDNDVKLAIINAFRTTGNGPQLMNFASSNNSPTLIRTSALNALNGIITPAELWTLYEKETDKNLKMQMIGTFSSMDAVDQLNRIIKSEKDLDLRRRALRSLGSRKSDKTGQMLVDYYGTEQDVETKKQIISSLANQGNAEGLVAIARKEPTLSLKTDIVRKLSEMAPKSKVAADYLMEIIK